MVLFFNKKLIEEYDLDDPYALVKSGEWTLDRLFSMSSEMLLDLNGDGEIKARTTSSGSLRQRTFPTRCFSARANESPILLPTEDLSL